jgi:hypothetical protein
MWYNKGAFMVTYSQAILTTLKSRGISLSQLRDAGIGSGTMLQAVSRGKREFTDSQVFKIERLSGFTGGQLATLFTEPRGGPLTDLMNGWAKVHRMLSSKKTKPLRKATVAKKLAASRVRVS